ncbi:MAG TPA: hypothetical protein VGG84_01070 [Gemmatimonadaceae bacterium]
MTASPIGFAARASRTPIRRALLAGATVGVLDGLAAVLFYTGALHVPPARIFQGIGRALLGMAAFTGGTSTALLGLAMHFGVAIGWAVVYAVLYSRSPALSQMTRTTGGALAVGAVYGAFVDLAMTFVVVPLTRIGPSHSPASIFVAMLVIHMVVVGPPIALIVKE